MTTTQADRDQSVPDHDAAPEMAVEEMRQLIVDLRDAAQDGRRLAQRYADLLRDVVDEYCVEFEQRAESALRRLERV